MAYESTETTSGGNRTLTAFFDSRTDADEAVQRLVAAGIPRGSIDVRSGAATGTTSTATTRDQDGGFWEALKDIFMPEDDRATYAEGLRRGGHIVVVRTDTQHYERALDILDDEGTVDLDQRAESWRSEGWLQMRDEPTTGAATASAASYAGRTGGALGSSSSAGTGAGYTAAGTGASASTGATAGTNAFASGHSTTSAAADNLTAGREEVIPITEEQLHVGKREVSHGRVRVRSYVVETPVQEQVGLREEQVFVERRPVDRAATGADTLFKERVIEAEERSEEAVIAKEARVTEELVVRKQAEERTQTVSDTVRRTEVEVEDDRGTTIGSQPRRAG
jgi:uncharacterized protein (TIGR02271 family)